MIVTERRIGGALVLVVSLFATARLTEAQKPQPKARAPQFSKVSVGQDFSCGLTRNSEALCWGGNYYGQLGARSASGIAPCPKAMNVVFTCAGLPVAVGAHRFTDLAAGIKHVCAVSTDKTVWC